MQSSAQECEHELEFASAEATPRENFHSPATSILFASQVETDLEEKTSLRKTSKETKRSPKNSTILLEDSSSRNVPLNRLVLNLLLMFIYR